MATVTHKNLPDAQRHEPKGASTASVDTVYVSDGAGSGTWAQAPYTYSLTAKLADLSTASSTYVVAPVGGDITAIYSVIENAITTANASLTFFIGATPITSSTITVTQSGSAAGDMDTSSPSAARTVSAGSVIKITTDGASDTACGVHITFKIAVG
jgi:hypothetical protein